MKLYLTSVLELLALWTDEEKTIIDRLCKQIADEQDPIEFTRLVKELNDLLENTHQRLDRKPEVN